jgi:hypothetical protein
METTEKDLLQKPSKYVEEANKRVVSEKLHRKLSLKVQGLGLVKEGDWRGLLQVAAHYGDKNWEIVESFALGERIVTKHVSLLQNHGE